MMLMEGRRIWNFREEKKKERIESERGRGMSDGEDVDMVTVHCVEWSIFMSYHRGTNDKC